MADLDALFADQDTQASTTNSAPTTPASQQNAPASPAPGILSTIGAGVGHGMGSIALGVQQLLGRGLTAMGSTGVGPWLSQDADTGLRNLDAQLQPYESANPVTAKIADVGGQVLPSLLIPGAAAESTLGRIGVGALQGATAGLVQPVKSGDYWQGKLGQAEGGALLGAAFPAAISGVQGIARNVSGLLSPVVAPGKYAGEGLAGALTPADAQAVADNIRSAQQFVPGSMPTTAQVGATPTLVQTEKALANASAPFKARLENLANDNNQARWNVLMDVAQTPQDLQAAQAARASAVAPLYDAANGKTANIGNAFLDFARRRPVQQAMQRANQLAQDDGQNTAGWWPTPDDPSITGQALDYTGRALRDMIGSAQSAGNNELARILTASRAWLQNWTQRYIPEVGQAAQTYAQMSVPVNTMEAAQQIANQIGTRGMNSAGIPQITLPAYRSALDSAMNDAKYGIDANALQRLQGIGQDLQRATVSNSIKTGGSDTAYNLAADGWLARQLYGQTFGGAGGVGKTLGAIGATVAGHPMAGLGILGAGNKVGQLVGQRLQSRLGDLLLDPQAFLPYLDRRVATAAQPVQNPLIQGLLRNGSPAIAAGLLGAFQ